MKTMTFPPEYRQKVAVFLMIGNLQPGQPVFDLF